MVCEARFCVYSIERGLPSADSTKVESVLMCTAVGPRLTCTCERSVVRLREPSDSVMVHDQPIFAPPSSMMYQRSSRIFHFAGAEVCAREISPSATRQATTGSHLMIGRCAGRIMMRLPRGLVAIRGASTGKELHRECWDCWS